MRGQWLEVLAHVREDFKCMNQKRDFPIFWIAKRSVAATGDAWLQLVASWPGDLEQGEVLADPDFQLLEDRTHHRSHSGTCCGLYRHTEPVFQLAPSSEIEFCSGARKIGALGLRSTSRRRFGFGNELSWTFPWHDPAGQQRGLWANHCSGNLRRPESRFPGKSGDLWSQNLPRVKTREGPTALN